MTKDKVNVLLVDDRPENLLSMAAVLEPLGERLVTAGSGEEALKRLLEDDFAETAQIAGDVTAATNGNHPAADATATTREGSRPPTEETAVTPARVLVAEDNPINQAVAVKMLERVGVRADVARDGREAVEMLARESYSAVLMDCQMPRLDGYGATAEIRRLEGSDRHTPIIAVTANAMKGDRERCLDAGMDDYLAKPVTPPGLRSVLEQWVTMSPNAGRALELG